jgi:hypothetical protein
LTAHTRDHASKHGVSGEDDIHQYVDHGAIQGLGDDDHTQYLKTDGTIALTGDMSAGGHKITNGATPVSSGDLTTKGYVDSLVQGIDWQQSVLSLGDNTPPVTPSIGDRYVVGTSPTGAWVGHENEIAQWSGTAWVFVVPNKGFAL